MADDVHAAAPRRRDVHRRLAGLPGRAGRAARACSGRRAGGCRGLLATHGDWDHLLARLVFPEAPLGVAETTAARLRAEPGVAQRRLREVDEDDYVTRARPLSLGQVQALPVPGKLDLGEDAELELIPADGHTADGMAIWAPFARVLCCGDYLSPVEIPMISEGGSRNAYLATLLRLAPYVEQADWIVPGHGAPTRRPARAGDPARGRQVPGVARADDAATPRAAAGAPRPRPEADPRREPHARRRERAASSTSRWRPARRRGRRGRVLGVAGVLARRAAGVPARARDVGPGARRDPDPLAVHLGAGARRPRRGRGAGVRRDHRALSAAGFTPEPRTPHWGAPRAYVRSPGGHLVELMAAPPTR